MRHLPATQSPRTTRRLLITAVVACTAASAGGCSGVQLDAARGLAGSGRDAFADLNADYRSMSDQYRQYNATVAVTDRLSNRPDGRRLNDMQAQRLQRQLRARMQVADAFAGAYRALDALATYDASGEVQRALGNLDGALALLGTAAGGPAGGAGAAVASRAIEISGSLIGGEAQRRRVRAASAAVRERLVVFRALHAGERDAMTGLLRDAINARYEQVQAWWGAGLLSLSPAVEQMAQGTGVAPLDGRTQPIRASTPGIAAAGNALINARREAARNAAEDGYDAVDTVVAELIEQHEKLEAGQDIDLARVRESIARLREIVAQLRQAAGQQAAAR